MFRLIYFNPLKGYGTLDSDDDPQILVTGNLLRDNGVNVVCIVDYQQKLILNKSPDYNLHRDFIDDLIFEPKFL
jgi:hypothetical protein